MYTNRIIEEYYEILLEQQDVMYIGCAKTNTNKDLILVGTKDSVQAIEVGKGRQRVCQCYFNIKENVLHLGAIKVPEVDDMNQDNRGKGIGTAVISILEDIAKVKKLERVELDSLRTSVGFYQKLGFEMSKEQKVGKKAPIHMEKEITNTPIKTKGFVAKCEKVETYNLPHHEDVQQ